MLWLRSFTSGPGVGKSEYTMVAIDHATSSSGVPRQARMTNWVDVPRDDGLSWGEARRNGIVQPTPARRA